MTEKKANVIRNSKIVKEPLYISELYSLIYHRKKVYRLLDDDRILSVLSFGQRKKIVDELVEDIIDLKGMVSDYVVDGEVPEGNLNKILLEYLKNTWQYGI